MEPMTTMIGPSVLDPSLCISDLKTKRKHSVLHELVAHAERAGGVRDVALLCDTLLLRERLLGTGIGKGVAVPHARSVGVIAPRLVVGRSQRGVEWESPDGVAVQVVLLVLSPAEASEDAHIARIVRATTLTRLHRNRSKLMLAEHANEVAELLAAGGPS
jgi:mannitol/fructose-specific phosphotransferase system IIA component (Ntr-type)